MPTSTVPNTPAHHSSGMETFLRSPQARARNRWGGDLKPNSPGEAPMANGRGDDGDEERLLEKTLTETPNTISASSPSPSRARRTAPCFLLLFGLIAIGIFFYHDERSVVVTDWVKEVSTSVLAKNEDRPEVRSTWLYVTGTSPFALERACEKHSAYKMFDEHAVALETPESIINSLKQRYDSGESLVVCGPPPLDLRDLQSLYINVVVYAENGLQAAFDPSFATWARARGLDTEIESKIDESCLDRRKKSRRKYSCTILEIGVLRAAEIWTKLGQQARSIPQFTVIDIGNELNENAKKRFGGLAHRFLLNQLLETHLQHFDGKGIPKPTVFPAYPDFPAQPVVDAGFCQVIYKGTEPEYLGPKAICLPNFVIIGAQKSGTDELAVWLNRNKFNRRMDGGVEVHFFDCVGRGRGGDRFSCDRKRSFLMMDHQRESRLSLVPNQTASEEVKSTDFSWAIERLQSPFLDDHVWRSYMRLGHLNNVQYHRNRLERYCTKSPRRI